jgi:carboxyl-terminal processing protease
MEKHWKPLFLSVAMSGGLYLWLSQLHGWSLHQAEAKTPGGFNNASQTEHDLASGKILSRVIDKVSKNYVDTDRIKPKEMFKASLDYLSKTTPEIMVQVESPDSLLLYVDTQKQSFSTKQITNLTELNYALRDVFAFLVKALPKGTNLRDIEYSAINGFLSTLDPHTILLKPDLFADMKANTDGQFGGLGIQIGLRDSTLTVIAPMSGTPASKEGVKANDKIIKIDGESTVNMDTDDAVDRLRGTPGTKVTITLMRKGWTEPRDFTIERAVIKLESVTARALPDGIGYVKLKNFQKNSFDDLRSALKNFEKDDVTNGLILDLRDNPGGLLEQSIKISDAFLTTGQIVSTVGKQDGQKVREDRPATNSRDEWTSPLIVLINGQSASASEIVSGALKNDNRALIVGTQSFGKGSVQVLYDFPDLSALKLTIAQYLTPGSVSIQGVGITPDIMLLPTTVASDRITYFTSEILTKEADLDAHLTSEFAAKPEEPSVKIHYYIDPKFEENTKKTLEDDANAFIEDPEITFARKLLVKAPGKTRAEMLKLSKSFSGDFAAEQESKITEALKAQNIDWTEGKSLSNNGSATATVAFDKNVTTLQAGDETKLTVTVKNTGSRALYRLRAQTKSDNGLFSEAEMFFGKVDPGQSKSYVIPVKIPKDAISRTDDVVYTFFEDGKSTPEPIKQRIQIKGLERPTFAYGYRISDDEGGNGNGLAEVGESVKFVLTVKNNGKGKSFETVAALKSYAGKAIQLKDGRTNIDNLAPGEQKTAVFTFDVKAKPEKGSNHLLEISIADLTLREYLGEKILLPVYDNAPKLTEEKIGLSVTTEGTNFYSGALDKSPIISTLSKGSQFTAKGRVGDFYKIVLADGTSGFVKATEVKTATVKAEKVKSKPTLQNSPPVIDLSAFTSTSTNDASIKFDGVVTDESNIHDMYILVNGKKVFYQANSNVSTELKYSAELPLEPGSNTIVIVARENADVTSQERLVIRRESSSK